MPQNPQNPNNPKETGLQNYARYSGLAFQMVAIILAFVWAGKKIDHIYFQDRAIFIIIFSLIGVFFSMYIVFKDLLNLRKKK
jgi:F0F1-type ATP synthase assembly protein I